MALAKENLDAIVTLTKRVCKDCNLDLDEIQQEEKETNGQENQENTHGDNLNNPTYKLVSHTYKQLQAKIQEAQSQLEMANEKICGLQTLLDKTEHKQPLVGVKRGRGRPSKSSGYKPPPHRRTLERPVKVTSYAERDYSSEVSDEYITVSHVRSTGGQKSKGRGRPRKDAPRSPAKRGRGRPPKAQGVTSSGGGSPSQETRNRGVSAIDYAETESSEQSIYESDATGETDPKTPSGDSKRGRGRPRKVANPAAGKTATPGKTPSVHSDSSDTSEKEKKAGGNPTGRKRGRPAMTVPVSENDRGIISEEKEGSSEHDAPVAKKGRGRPPKIPKLTSKVAPSNTPAVVKKGRGRPKKNSVPLVKEAEAQDVCAKEKEGDFMENGKETSLAPPEIYALEPMPQLVT